MYPVSIEKLIKIFSKFPTIGPRTAGRFVFYLLKLPEEEIKELISAVSSLKENIKLCRFCFKPFETKTDQPALCEICSNPNRQKTLLCILEKESDLNSLEKTKKFKGLYFILGGTVSALKKNDLENLRTAELQERIKRPEKFGLDKAQFKEIIIATNLTIEGETTALYLERLLKSLKIKTTRLGRGLPVGGELEYADEETLGSALEGRK